jgi:hypothetical protein
MPAQILQNSDQAEWIQVMKEQDLGYSVLC